MCRHGELVHRRKTTEAALRKAREMSKNGCHDSHVRIIEHYLRVDVRYLPRSGFFVTKVGLSRVQVL
jgi:hypothetical protein